MTNNLSFKPTYKLEKQLSYGDDMQEVYKIYDVPLYSSKEIIDTTKEVISSSKYLFGYNNKIIKMIDKNIIIPTRYNKSYLRKLAFNLKVFFLGQLGLTSIKDDAKSQIGGFFTSEENKIFLLLDNYANVFDNLEQKGIAQLLIHELSHYCASNYEKKYFIKTKPTIIKWYSSFFKKFFDIKETEQKELVRISYKYYNIAYNIETERYKDLEKTFKKIYDLLITFKSISNIKEDNLKNRINRFLYYIVSCLSGKLDTRYAEDILVMCYATYVKNLKCTGKYIKYTLFYQEFLFPSEILAIASIEKQYASMYLSLL